MSFIDLDMKPLGKMMHYYGLDQKIVCCCMKMMKNEISANVEEKTSYQDKSIVVEDDYPTRELAGNLTHLYHLLLLLFLFSFLTS